MPAYKDSKTGTWFVKFYCKDWTGENKQIKKRGFVTKREALDYELYGNQICHDTDRSFVVWFDEEECKYIELKEIKPIRPNTYDDYELNIKILYGDAED